VNEWLSGARIEDVEGGRLWMTLTCGRVNDVNNFLANGSHIQLIHPTEPGVVTVSFHAQQTLTPRVLLSILHQAGLTVDELRALL
jgi:hypothetical protein